MCYIQKNDVGLAIRVTIKDQDDIVVDVSGATTKELIFKKPDDSIVTKTASFYTDGTDGVIQYVTESNFLDTAGIWSVQGHIVLAGGEWKTTIDEFSVNKNLE